MPLLPEVLTPAPDERGLASGDLDELGRATVAAWDAFLGLARTTDLSAPARSRTGATGRDVVVQVGAWPDSRRLGDIIADARGGRSDSADARGGRSDSADARGGRSDIENHDEQMRRLVSAHADAGDEAVWAAVRLGRDDLADWFAGPRDEALLMAPSLLGPLPVATLLAATAYQLALASLDLVACGAEPDPGALATGLTALVDTTGALAARVDVTASISALSPQVRIGSGAHAGAWRTQPVGIDDDPGPAIEAPVAVILDVTGGRASAPLLYARGDLRTHDLAGLLRLVRVLEGVPGIPAGATLARAAGVLESVASAGSAFGSALGRLTRRRPDPDAS